MHRRHALSAWKSMKACMRRELILMSRHRFVYFFRIAQVLSPFITCLGRQYCLILFFLVPHFFSSIQGISDRASNACKLTMCYSEMHERGTKQPCGHV